VETPSEILARIRAPDLLGRPLIEVQRLAARLLKRPDVVDAAGHKVKIAVLSSFLTSYLVEMLTLMLVRRGLVPEITSAHYGQLVGEVLNNGPALQGNPDLVLFLPSHRDLRRVPPIGTGRDEADALVREETAFWRDLVQSVPAPVVMLSFDQPPYRALAEGDGFLPSGVGRHVRHVNIALADALPRSVSLVDAEALQMRLGPLRHDSRLYGLCKQPFAMDGLIEVADTLAAAIVATLGRAKKVLVLDLDNTLWGGVVGDVGIEGLILGPESQEGEAFIEFQRYAKRLAERGVLLAVCSKNDEAIARGVFRNHSAMVLRETDISCFVANFDDKATNLRRIAQTLNLGVEALVFVDDSPIERRWVARELPDVTVIDLPDDPAAYCRAVEAAKLFPLHHLTSEDLTRNASYQAIAAVKSASSAGVSMDAFLQDLQPVATIEPVGDASLDRIVQLVAKTNQFKLNATTFTHDDIRRRAGSVIALRLADRLQDYGIVTVAIAEMQDDALVVMNWVMSCRVFGRRLEHVMRHLLGLHAVRAGATRVSLRYVASKRNGLLPDILSSIGFTDAGGDGVYEAPAVAPSELSPHHMSIIDHAEEPSTKLMTRIAS
jgi:FkbH-like protein